MGARPITRMALEGIRVLEFSGLAPGPFCGMILADYGATVTRIDKVGSVSHMDRLARGKRSVAVDLKTPKGCEVIRQLSRNSDVLIEPFRSGVMENLGLGPDNLCKENPSLIYARLTGYGQSGSLSKAAGHDINYLAISGLLSTFGRAQDKPYFPVNLMADFAGGGLMCAFGIVMALYERSISGHGQVIDANMVEGAAYIGSWLWRSRDLFIWGKPRGENILDGGAHFYDTYKTSDGKYMAVGAIEVQFYANLLKGLGLTEKEAPHMTDFAATREKFTAIFATKTQTEWCEIFNGTDACVTPVLSLDEAAEHPHNTDRRSFMMNRQGGVEPQVAPRLSKSPGVTEVRRQPFHGEHTTEVLQEAGYSMDKIRALLENSVVEQGNCDSKI